MKRLQLKVDVSLLTPCSNSTEKQTNLQKYTPFIINRLKIRQLTLKNIGALLRLPLNPPGEKKVLKD